MKLKYFIKFCFSFRGFCTPSKNTHYPRTGKKDTASPFSSQKMQRLLNYPDVCEWVWAILRSAIDYFRYNFRLLAPRIQKYIFASVFWGHDHFLELEILV